MSEGKIRPLTENQRKLLGYIGDGLNTKEIAIKLGLTRKAVEYHRSNLYYRLGVNSIPQLIRIALAFGLSSL